MNPQKKEKLILIVAMEKIHRVTKAIPVINTSVLNGGAPCLILKKRIITILWNNDKLIASIVVYDRGNNLLDNLIFIHNYILSDHEMSVKYTVKESNFHQTGVNRLFYL